MLVFLKKSAGSEPAPKYRAGASHLRRADPIAGRTGHGLPSEQRGSPNTTPCQLRNGIPK